MIDQSALQYLFQHLEGYTPIKGANSASQLVTIPKDSEIASLERYQAEPNDIRQHAALSSCASFCDYVNRFKDDQTSIYLNVEGGTFEAVLDHHGREVPRWGRHKASFAPKRSLEWRAWSAIHKRSISQIELAHFIEERLDDIVEPEPNEMLKAALDFQANEKLALASSTNLDDGSVRFSFQKDNAVRSVTFPHRIAISIPVHENEPRTPLEGRIRYKVDGDGVLQFTFSFVDNPELVLRNALLGIADRIRSDTKGLHHYEGGLG